MPLKPGCRLTGTIDGYDGQGRGRLRVASNAVAIPFTAVGDEVNAILVRRVKGVNVAKLESITSSGADRVAAPCPHAGTCGGCLWQHLAYDAQLKIKLSMLNTALEQAGHLERVATIVPAVEQFQHRNRMDYVVGWKGEIGLKEYGSWSQYVNLKTCLLLNDGVGEILQRVRDWMRMHDLQPWDAKFHRGDVRYVVVREGKNTGQRLIVVVIKDLTRVTTEMKHNLSSAICPLSSSLLLGEQALITDISLAQKFEILSGNPWLEENVNGVTYRIHPNSFFQTNTKMAEKLQEVIRDAVEAGLVPDRKDQGDRKGRPYTILDLYCGLGFFGIYLAKTYGQTDGSSLHVHGVEIDADAVALARHNAETNGVADRCNFTVAKAEDLSWRDILCDALILDPPRSGLHPHVLKAVIEKRPPTIIYVSCNYKRLVEELKHFKTHYSIEKLTALDMFPHTPHVEMVVKLVTSCRS